MQSVIQGWSLKTPHNRLRLSVTNDEGHEGHTSWRLDTEYWERFAKTSTLDMDATTAWHDSAAGRMVLPIGPLSMGHYETPYTSRGVAGQGRYAYIANTRGGLHIVDLAVPETPRPMGKLFMYGEPKALAKYDRYVYLAAIAVASRCLMCHAQVRHGWLDSFACQAMPVPLPSRGKGLMSARMNTVSTSMG
jgi:hypothetical protein